MSLASSILIRNVRVPCSLQILKKKHFKKYFLYLCTLRLLVLIFFHFFLTEDVSLSPLLCYYR